VDLVTRPRISKTEPESEWMAETARGDHDAFRRIVERYQQTVLNLAYRFSGDADASLDLAQDIFLKVYQSAPRYKPEARFSTWLYRVAVNHCLNQVRDHIRSERLSHSFRDSPMSHEWFDHSSPGPGASSPEGLLLEREKAMKIRKAIKDLPPRQRMALILQRYHGFRYAEIATLMECSVGAVESMLVRAMDQLRVSLKDFWQGKGGMP